MELNEENLKQMDPESAFDAVMKHAPFIRNVIENKIASEVGPRDTEIKELKENMEQLTATLLMTAAASMMMGGK